MSTKTVTYNGAMGSGSVAPLTHSVPQAAQASSLSIRSIWAAIADGRLHSVTVGRRRLIPDSSLRRFLGLS
jgi:hypothetical protein